MSIQRYGSWRDVLMVMIVALLLCTGKTARAAFYADVIDGGFSECRMTKVGDSYEVNLPSHSILPRETWPVNVSLAEAWFYLYTMLRQA